jgi:hydroxymethylbilane synthase
VIRIATRKSPLAIWQAEHVRARLASIGVEAELVRLSTQGDRVLDRGLAEIGGKGLFIKELEEAMRDGRADLAVHSAKDVPYALPEGFSLSAFLSREDPRDALISARYRSFAELPAGATIGTSSARRTAQLLDARPDLRIVPIRGNVQTRLARVGELDAVVLALAGLRRLGLVKRDMQILPVELSLPAPGQGALAIEALAGSCAAQLAARLNEDAVARCVRAERAVMRALSADCTVPLAAYAIDRSGSLWLRAAMGCATEVVRARAYGEHPEDLGARVAAAIEAKIPRARAV